MPVPLLVSESVQEYARIHRPEGVVHGQGWVIRAKAVTSWPPGSVYFGSTVSRVTAMPKKTPSPTPLVPLVATSGRSELIVSMSVSPQCALNSMGGGILKLPWVCCQVTWQNHTESA